MLSKDLEVHFKLFRLWKALCLLSWSYNAFLTIYCRVNCLNGFSSIVHSVYLYYHKNIDLSSRNYNQNSTCFLCIFLGETAVDKYITTFIRKTNHIVHSINPFHYCFVGVALGSRHQPLAHSVCFLSHLDFVPATVFLTVPFKSGELIQKTLELI